jgi:ketosteroid isomerase-like protein
MQSVPGRDVLTGFLVAVAVAAAWGTGGPLRAQSATADPATRVRETERAFARTMADRNHAAFVAFLAEEAVFFGEQRVLRGKAQVADAWKRYYEGAAAPFAWAPDRVEVVASGALAFSTGPVFGPDGARIGTFNSVWRLEADGRWRIVFDAGCPPCTAK